MTPASSVWLKCLLFGLLAAGGLIALNILLDRQASLTESLFKGLLFGLPFGLAQYWGLKAKAHDTQQTKQKDNT